jgi:tripartite-type tricarboxylate transporter receptor subunit TctC
MQFRRRQFLRMGAAIIALPALSKITEAQAYPSRPVHVVVPFPPGGNTDLIARLVGQWLSQRLGQPFIIENRPGAGTNLGTEVVVRAPADGYTLLSVHPPSAINATLYDKLNFHFIRDVTPIAGIARAPFVMVVNPSLPARSIPELIAYAKANPDRINMASAGIGSGPHVAGELFKMMAGVSIVHVPYRGTGPALTDLIGGQVQIYFDGIPTSVQYIRSGQLRALAVTSSSRSEVLPEVPPMADFLPGFEASFWSGLGARTDTPRQIVESLNTEINACLDDPKIKARLAKLGGTTMPGSPADFGNFIVGETEKWRKVVKYAGIKPE